MTFSDNKPAKPGWTVLALWLAIALLVFGTQMPGAWKDSALDAAGLPWQATKVAHFSMFMVIAWLCRQEPLRWTVWYVLGLALLLACVTEVLQFWAKDRQPGMADVAIDMAGAVFGWWLAARAMPE